VGVGRVCGVGVGRVCVKHYSTVRNVLHSSLAEPLVPKAPQCACCQLPFAHVPTTGGTSVAGATILLLPHHTTHHNHQQQSPPQSVIDQVQQAARTWGFFQLINHGISSQLLDEHGSMMKR
jgi:hypothetical protein